MCQAKRFFVSNWYQIAFHLIQRINWFAIVITLLIALLFLAATASGDQATLVVGFSKATWAAVAGSVFAASLFLSVQSIIDAIKEAAPTLYKKFYDSMVHDIGLKGIYEVRGSKTNEIYKSLITKAEKRIWAIGMTNRHFIDNHQSAIVHLICNKPIEVIVAFWDPGAKLEINSSGKRTSQSIIESQLNFEHGTVNSATHWAATIKKRQNELLTVVKQAKATNGELTIMNLAVVTNISCLIIDDDVFFFPFLAAIESTDGPMIHVTANDKLGQPIVKHFEALFNSKIACNICHKYPPTRS